MVVQSYTECFWGGDLNSTLGFDALVKRNHDSKKVCQELEEYLKKRSKLESEFGKSLSNLSKCFKYRDQIGQLETTLNQFKSELDTMAISHNGAAAYFSKQAEDVKLFREEQSVKVKQVEECLNKAQSSKLNQLTRTMQLEKTYVKKSIERDFAVNNLREVEKEGLQGKELDKVKTKQVKSEEDAQKADSNYKSGVYLLESLTTAWEKSMEDMSMAVQELDEKRVKFLRQELWTCINVDSKLSLDIDNSCESVRNTLEKCDVEEEIQSFLRAHCTGTVKPKHYSFKHYTSNGRDLDSDAESTTSSNENNDDDKANQNTLRKKNVFTKFKNPLKQ